MSHTPVQDDWYSHAHPLYKTTIQSYHTHIIPKGRQIEHVYIYKYACISNMYIYITHLYKTTDTRMLILLIKKKSNPISSYPHHTQGKAHRIWIYIQIYMYIKNVHIYMSHTPVQDDWYSHARPLYKTTIQSHHQLATAGTSNMVLSFIYFTFCDFHMGHTTYF